MSRWIAVIEDHSGGRHYVLRLDQPGFLTDDIDDAQRFDAEGYARGVAEAFASLTVTQEGSDDIWRPKWIARVYAERSE